MAVGSLQVKVCGMRDVALAQRALELGADWIGMIHHANSPRHLDLGAIETLAGRLPAGVRVGVVVEPDPVLLERLWACGLDVLQVHLVDWVTEKLKRLRAGVPTGKQLWLAPKLPPQTPFPTDLLEYADRMVIDSYVPQQVGGTGVTGDWGAFRRCLERWPDRSGHWQGASTKGM
jgi:phosphoribosylanthranilate isomerase